MNPPTCTSTPTLFALPREIRDKVYSFLLLSSGYDRNESTKAQDFSKSLKRSQGKQPIVDMGRTLWSFRWDDIDIAIIVTCKQVASEATAILYRYNAFSFVSPM